MLFYNQFFLLNQYNFIYKSINHIIYLLTLSMKCIIIVVNNLRWFVTKINITCIVVIDKTKMTRKLRLIFF